MGLIERWQPQWDPGGIAIAEASHARTWSDLWDDVRRATGWLASQGIGAGDVVSLVTPKDPAFLATNLAALRLGAVTLALNDRYTDSELAWPLAHAGPRLAVLPDERIASTSLPCRSVPASALERAFRSSPPLDPERAVGDDAPALLLYTSGTTGRPKGAVTTHGQVHATVEALRVAWGWRRDDVLLHALPHYHVHGLVVASYGALAAGARTEWLGRFDAEEVRERLIAGPATIFMGVPTFWVRLLALPPRPDERLQLRLATSGSAALPATVHAAARARFGVDIVERYGMTEIGIVVSNPLEAPRPGSIGRPLPGVELRIHEPGPDGVGEVWIRGPSVFGGYLRDPEATARALVDGWMRTGDLGRQGADGFVTLVGRGSELVIVGGFNVYPAEIEAALLRIPGVREAAVFGAPDDELGEVAVAAVVGDALDPDRVRSLLRAELAGYKVPRRIVVLDELPRNAMGKVLKSSLARDHATPAEGEG